MIHTLQQENPTIILKEGSLYKLSRHLKKWRERWCIITNQYLMTCKKQGQLSSPTEKIHLSTILSIKECPELSMSIFKIITIDGQTFYFDAICFNDRNSWMSDINRYVSNWYDCDKSREWKELISSDEPSIMLVN